MNEVRVVTWDFEGSDVCWDRLMDLAGTLTADVVCVQGLSGWAAAGRFNMLAGALGMSAHVARDPAGDEAVIFTGSRVEVREFLSFPTAIAITRIDGWELTVVATELCAMNASARLRHVQELSRLAGDVVLCGCFHEAGPLLTDAGFRDAASGHIWITPGLAGAEMLDCPDRIGSAEVLVLHQDTVLVPGPD